MPREVAAVRAHMACKLQGFTGHSVLPKVFHTGCPTDNQAVRRFAYDCNVDVAAWRHSHHLIPGHFRHAESDALLAFFS